MFFWISASGGGVVLCLFLVYLYIGVKGQEGFTSAGKFETNRRKTIRRNAVGKAGCFMFPILSCWKWVFPKIGGPQMDGL